MKASHLVGAAFASMALLACSNSLAGSMAATPITIDTATAPDVVVLPDISVTLGANLTYADDVLIRVAGADPVAVDLQSLPGLITCVGYTSSPIGYATVAPGNWVFRVTDVNGLASGLNCTFHGLAISKGSIDENCQVTSSYEARRFITGQLLDSAGPVTVANVSSCGPPPPTIVTIQASSIRGATDYGEQDGTFDDFVPQLSVNNNGWTSLATAFEFDLASIPAGAQIEMAALGLYINAAEGTRQLAVSAYAGDGVVSLADFATGALVERRAVDASSLAVFIDVTGAVAGWLADRTPFGGFNLREDPANCCNYTVMGVEGQPLFPALYVAYRVAPAVAVGIDIRPGTEPNNVNLRSQGNIPVAILSAAEFYAPTEVAIDSLRFGRAGTEASLSKCNSTPEDVNLDGLMDLVCHFGTQATRLETGDSEGILTAETIGGVNLKGRDAVRVVP